MKGLALALVVLAWTALPAGAQAPPPDPATVEGVTVEAARERLGRQVDSYLKGAMSQAYGESAVRWRRAICPLVAGLPKDQGEYVLSRLSRVAAEAGAPLASGDCRPNLYIVVTPEPRALLKTWKTRDPGLFGYELPARVRRFIEDDRPVRAWHNWAYEAPDTADTGTLVKRRRDVSGAGALKDSRIEGSVVRNDWGAVLVVDSTKTAGITLAPLADYLALSALVETNPDASFAGAPTILRLFEGGERPDALSDWDRAFLKALYAGDGSVKMERSQLVSRILREVR